MLHKPNCFALTGGPGAGKTMLIRHLRAQGFACVDESARAVIQAEGGRPTAARFCRLMHELDLAAFIAADGPTLFDRGLVDAWGTLRAMGGPAMPDLDEAVRSHRYNQIVFVAPPWREIYVNDAERDQTWDQAVASYEGCVTAYEACGYRLLELPRASVTERAALVLDAMDRF
jgi:predicted ATPase